MMSVSIVKASAFFALIFMVCMVEYNCEKFNDDYYESRGKLSCFYRNLIRLYTGTIIYTKHKGYFSIRLLIPRLKWQKTLNGEV